MADPPWHFSTYSEDGQDKSPSRHYETQGLDWIERMPVEALCARDCLLWLWTPAAFVPAALGVMQAWGFVFSTMGTWCKTTRRGKIAFGTGYVLRNATEHYLIGRRGAPRIGSKSVRSVIHAPAREHSRKPDEAYRDARLLIPEGPAVELFARERREGWISWGNEAEKFPHQADKCLDVGTVCT
ncbi:UNVERIFIED_CONTAM: hypothetical protein BEN50_22370 [Euhalothece sp. KZN 001]